MASDSVKPKRPGARGNPLPADPAARRGYARGVADSVRKLTKTIFARQGFAEADVVTRWRDIVGPDLADHCLPERLVFPRDGGAGTLHIAASGAFATELQHLSPQLLDRINGYFGFPAVGRITIRQAPVALLRPRRKARPRPLSATEKEALAELTKEVKTPELKAALQSLGEVVLAPGDKGG